MPQPHMPPVSPSPAVPDPWPWMCLSNGVLPGPASGTYQSPYNNHRPSLEPVDQSQANGHLSQSRDTSPPTAQQSPANLESPTAHSTPDRSGPEPGALQENGGPNQTPNGQLPAQSALDPASPLKRTYSGTMEEPRESMEKRQKIGETQNAPADFDFNALLANAAAVGAQQLAQQHEQSSTNGANSLSSSITVGRISSEPTTSGGVEALAANTTMTRAASSTGRLDQTQILSLIFLESLVSLPNRETGGYILPPLFAIWDSRQSDAL